MGVQCPLFLEGFFRFKVYTIVNKTCVRRNLKLFFSKIIQKIVQRDSNITEADSKANKALAALDNLCDKNKDK